MENRAKLSGNVRPVVFTDREARDGRGVTTAAAGMLVATLLASPAAQAQMVVSPVTGHAYERFLGTMTWDEARATARLHTYNGKRGYLATITTAEEQSITRFNWGDSGALCWLGGRQLPGAPEPAGGWVWDNGEPWVNTWWSPGFPSNNDGQGHNLNCVITMTGSHRLWMDWWGADTNPLSVKGYIVEWDCVELSLVGPETVTTCPGGTASFSVVAMGTGPFTYAWHKGGVPINTIANPSAATATLILTNVSAADAGTYGCSATGACTSWTSDPATLIVSCSNQADVAGIGNAAGCDGQVTVDDVVYYLGQFFGNNIAVADIVGVGGVGPPEGAVTVDDLVAFLNSFFNPCA